MNNDYPKIRHRAAAATTLLLAVFLLCVSCSDGNDSTNPGNTAKEGGEKSGAGGCAGCLTFASGGAQRQYLLRMPDDLPDMAPLVFVLHGGGGTIAGIDSADFNALGAENGFAIVYPQGLPHEGEGAIWNAGLTISSVDDAGFLASLARFLQNEHGFDPARTFTSGISNGGFMSYHLVATHPQVFKAAASIIGTMTGGTWDIRNSIQPAPILQISGALDEIIPLNGSPPGKGGWGGAPGMMTIIQFWADLSRCMVSTNSRVNPTTTVYTHSDCINGNMIRYYLIDNLGHNVPAGDDNSIDAFEIVWEFFSQFPSN